MKSSAGSSFILSISAFLKDFIPGLTSSKVVTTALIMPDLRSEARISCSMALFHCGSCVFISFSTDSFSNGARDSPGFSMDSFQS